MEAGQAMPQTNLQPGTGSMYCGLSESLATLRAQQPVVVYEETDRGVYAVLPAKLDVRHVR